uniref:V-set and transmembrane domain-containing protein 2-like protein n=1 Tax=Serinus canaria TaxID=9135 RepID=A0A8C9UG70_SERCA
FNSVYLSLALSPAALFTEIPHDMTAQAGEDVEMACSFRGSGSPSYSLEIQWWYVRNHKDWTDKQTWASSQVMSLVLLLPGSTERLSPPVVGSNISHKLRLSRVKLEDEGTYECRVIDSSDGKARHHKVKAYLRVEAAGGPGHPQDTELREAPLAELAAPGVPSALAPCAHHSSSLRISQRMGLSSSSPVQRVPIPLPVLPWLSAPSRSSIPPHQATAPHCPGQGLAHGRLCRSANSRARPCCPHG